LPSSKSPVLLKLTEEPVRNLHSEVPGGKAILGRVVFAAAQHCMFIVEMLFADLLISLEDK